MQLSYSANLHFVVFTFDSKSKVILWYIHQIGPRSKKLGANINKSDLVQQVVIVMNATLRINNLARRYLETLYEIPEIPHRMRRDVWIKMRLSTGIYWNAEWGKLVVQECSKRFSNDTNKLDAIYCRQTKFIVGFRMNIRQLTIN